MLFRSTVTQLHHNFKQYLSHYEKELATLEDVLIYLKQTRAAAAQLKEWENMHNQVQADYEMIGQIYANALFAADMPADNMSPQEFQAMFLDSQYKGTTAAPLQQGTAPTILLDRNMAQIIKTKPLTDQARPADIQNWSETIISVYRLQQLDRSNAQIALIYIKSHLDPALSAILSCFMDNKPLYLSELDTYQAYVQLPVDQRDDRSMVRVVYKHFAMQWSRLKLMLNFWGIKQKPGETYPEYAARVKTEFAMVNEFENRDEFIGFKLIEGATDQNLKKELAKLDVFTLKHVDEKGLEYHKRILNQRALNAPGPLSANATSKKNNQKNKPNKGGGQATYQQNNSAPMTYDAYFKQIDNKGLCRYCGYRKNDNHSCPAKGEKCNACGKKDHFQKMCAKTHVGHKANQNKQNNQQQQRGRSKSRGRGRSRSKSQKRKVNQTESRAPSAAPPAQTSATSVNYVSAFNVMVDPQAMPMVDLIVSECTSHGQSLPMQFVADTGSQVSLVIHDQVKHLYPIVPTTQKVVAANGTPLKIVGSIILQARFHKNLSTIEFLVARDVKHNLLSLKDCQDLGILRFTHGTSLLTVAGQERRFIPQMADFLQQHLPPPKASLDEAQLASIANIQKDYEDVLGDDIMGVFKDAAPIELTFKSDYRPSRVSRAPVIPIHLRAAVRAELEELLSADIIRPIDRKSTRLNSSHSSVSRMPSSA